jgi:hypothetical protein
MPSLPFYFRFDLHLVKPPVRRERGASLEVRRHPIGQFQSRCLFSHSAVVSLSLLIKPRTIDVRSEPETYCLRCSLFINSDREIHIQYTVARNREAPC